MPSYRQGFEGKLLKRETPPKVNCRGYVSVKAAGVEFSATTRSLVQDVFRLSGTEQERISSLFPLVLPCHNYGPRIVSN